MKPDEKTIKQLLWYHVIYEVGWTLGFAALIVGALWARVTSHEAWPFVLAIPVWMVALKITPKARNES